MFRVFQLSVLQPYHPQAVSILALTYSTQHHLSIAPTDQNTSEDFLDPPASASELKPTLKPLEMVSRTSLVAFLFTLITLAIAQDSAPDSETAPTNVTLAQAMQSLAASDPQPQISELASLAAATPTATGSANSASSCQCLMPGLWCGTRSGNATLNAIVNGNFNGTHHDGAWNGTLPEGYPHGLNGTHHDGEWNGTQPEDHHHYNGTRPEHRPQTLSGTCDWSTIYYCPEGSAPATNSLPCSQSKGKMKHCRELPMSFFDWCD